MNLSSASLLALATLLGGCALAGDEAGAGDEIAGSGDETSGGPAGSGGNQAGGERPAEPIWVDAENDGTTASNGATAASTGSGTRFEPADDPTTNLEACSEVPAYAKTAHASVDDSNAYASPMLVRELTGDTAWSVGDPLPVRANEFLNAYGQKIIGGLLDEDVDESLHVGVDARVDADVDYLGRRLVRLAVSLTSYNAAEVAVPDVTFVTDASESMGGEAVERLQAVVRGAGNTISPTRSVAALTTAGAGTVIREMQPWRGPEDGDAIATAAKNLTNAVDFEGTLTQAFDIARARAAESATPGVVLVVTDGTNDALSTSAQQRIATERSASPPVRLVGVGVGPARAYVDDFLDHLTDASGGAYFYAPSKEAAQHELETRFTSLTQIAARNVQLNLDLPDTVTLVGVAGEGEPFRDGLTDGQNLGADTSMIFQVYLLADADVDCQSVGVSLSWTDPRDGGDDAEPRTFPGEGALRDIPIWRRFGYEPIPSESFTRIEAIVAAADAMRGPTAPRLQHAVDFIDVFLTAVPDDPVTALCAPLARFCADEGIDCLICSDPTFAP